MIERILIKFESPDCVKSQMYYMYTTDDNIHVGGGVGGFRRERSEVVLGGTQELLILS